MATNAKEIDDWESGPKKSASKEVDDWDSSPVNPSQKRAARLGDKPLDLMEEYRQAGYRQANGDTSITDYLTGLIDKATLGNLQYFPKWKEQVTHSDEDSPRSMKLGRGTAVGAMGLGSAILLPTGLPAAVAAGAGQGALENPGENLTLGEDFMGRAKNAGKGAAVSLGLGLAGKGLAKAGDYAMQKAVGAKEYISGLGNRMADEGLIGTKGMMRKQIENKLPLRERDLTAAIQSMQQKPISNAAAEAALRTKASGYMPKIGPEGPMPIPTPDAPFVNSALTRAEEAATQRPELFPETMLDTARKIAKPAYNPQTGTPLTKFEHELSQAEAGAMKEQLKKAAEAQGIPAVREALAKEEALLKARRALGQKETLPEILMRLGPRFGLGTGGTYLMSGGNLPLAATAGLATTPAGLSTIGQLGTKSSQAIPYLTPAAIEAFMQKQYGGQE